MKMNSRTARALFAGALLLTAAAVPVAGQTAANGDIVLHAKRAVGITGAWGLVNDTSAAGGVRIANPDTGAAKLETALGSPRDYFELPFTAEPGRGYHLWIRSKAQNDSWRNDSVFVQFSGSVTSSGSAKFRIGTSSAAMYTLEEGSGAGVSAWGWQDNGYGYGVLGETIYFTGTSQVLRVQAREDGISIDQIVLSPVDYAAKAPGLGKNDTTIIAEPGAAPAPAPSGTGTWVNQVNASVNGAVLKKTSGCAGCPDAGGVGSAPMTSGSVAFSVTGGYHLVVGLGRDTSAGTGAAIDYAFNFGGNGAWDIRESGVYRAEGSFASSDVFKVAIEGTTVKYYRNGALVYTSKTAVSAPLVVDASMFSVGATAQIVAVTAGTTTTPAPAEPAPSGTGAWINQVNASVNGAVLKKTSGCAGCPDAGGVGSAPMTSGSVAFNVTGGYHLVVGLGRDTSAGTGAAIDYAFNFGGNGTWDIRESGVYRAEGPFASSDVFKVAIEGSTVKYYRNGALVYTSKTAVSAPLVVDASMFSVGATAQIVAVTAGTTTTTEPAPTTSATLRVLQWATRHGGFGTDGVYDTNRIATWVAKMNPDVVMFTEIEKYTYWGNQDQPEIYKNLLQQKTGKTWYYVTAQEYGQWSSNGKMNMILSRFPINHVDRYVMMQNYDRSVALAEITVNGRPITLVNTHLDPYDKALRLAQAKEVTTWAAPQPENRILAGDMNAWPDQTSILHLNTLYHDSWAVAASKGTAVAFSGNSGETKSGRIDYIFYSRGSANLVVKASQVYDTRDANGVMPSDHRPVVTTFEVK